MLAALFVAVATGTAAAQQPADDGWDVAIYPIFGWLPVSIELDVNLPPLDLPGDGGGGIDAEILDKRFDGAYFGGFSAAKGRWFSRATPCTPPSAAIAASHPCSRWIATSATSTCRLGLKWRPTCT